MQLFRGKKLNVGQNEASLRCEKQSAVFITHTKDEKSGEVN